MKTLRYEQVQKINTPAAKKLKERRVRSFFKKLVENISIINAGNLKKRKNVTVVSLIIFGQQIHQR